jgi:large subunit ribosomal protein L15
VPKLRGFTNKWRKEYAPVNLGKLNRFDRDSVVDGEALAQMGLIAHPTDLVKILGAGKLKVPVTVRVHRVSAAARTALEAAGGRVELLEVRERPVPSEPEATPAEPEEEPGE